MPRTKKQSASVRAKKTAERMNQLRQIQNQETDSDVLHNVTHQQMSCSNVVLKSVLFNQPLICQTLI